LKERTAIDPSEKRLWATKGESVVCLKGHPICDISRDIYVGEGRSAKDFTNWRQREPDRTTPVNTLRCWTCRSIWVRRDSKRNTFFHFAEGWR
jgi:hypothetical protein